MSNTISLTTGRQKIEVTKDSVCISVKGRPTDPGVIPLKKQLHAFQEELDHAGIPHEVYKGKDSDNAERTPDTVIFKLPKPEE